MLRMLLQVLLKLPFFDVPLSCILLIFQDNEEDVIASSSWCFIFWSPLVLYFVNLFVRLVYTVTQPIQPVSLASRVWQKHCNKRSLKTTFMSLWSSLQTLKHLVLPKVHICFNVLSYDLFLLTCNREFKHDGYIKSVRGIASFKYDFFPILMLTSGISLARI